MSDNYYNKKYIINSKVRDMIESKLGRKIDLSHVQIENIISTLFKGENNKVNGTFTEKDKEKILFILNNTSPNSFIDNVCINVAGFLIDNFTTDEVKTYIEHCITKYYHPGQTYRGVKISNKGLMNLISKTELYPLTDGIIINKKDVNDIINYFDLDKENLKFKYDKNLQIIDKDFSDEIREKLNSIQLDYKFKTHSNDKIFVISASDEKSFEYLKEQFQHLKTEKILDLDYYKEKEEDEDEEDGELEKEYGNTMDLGNGISLRGNLTNIGNIGGTQIIGVGSGGTQSDNDDALDMMNRIMNGDMSTCGRDEDDVVNNTPTHSVHQPITKTGENTVNVNIICKLCGDNDIRINYKVKNDDDYDILDEHDESQDWDELSLSDDLDINVIRDIVKKNDYILTCHGRCEDELGHVIFNGEEYYSDRLLNVIISEYDKLCDVDTTENITGEDDGKIDCNHVAYPNRCLLERIFESKEWKEILPRNLKNPLIWGDGEKFEFFNDSETLVTNPTKWVDNHSFSSYFIHNDISTFKYSEIDVITFVKEGSTDRDITVYTVGHVIIAWYYHED